jgi:peptidoglycan/LPS O-acetylase OafA/YrhL
MYAILAMMWVGLWVLGSLREKLLPYCIVALAGLAFLIRFYIHFHVHGERHVESTRMIYMFFTGATFYVLKEHITLSRRVFLVALAALLLSAFHREVFYVVYNIVLAYILFWIAYVPGGFIRAFNRLGDYSYGTYIYAFPVTQSFLALMPGVRVPVLILLSAVVTLTLASLSWHLIEKRALSLKASPGKIFRRVTGPNSGRQPVQAQ